MITVIADDITGAAEIAGVCLRYGLSVALDVDIAEVPHTEAWVIATNTRSLKEEEAIEETRKIAAILKKKGISNIFKKIDSVLRGHIIAEIKALLEFIPKSRVLILPANPEMGRTINHGRYYIHGEMLSLTSFADDPDFPARFSSVDKILNTTPEDSALFMTPDIMNMSDYKDYASPITDDILFAGGSVFFEAVLNATYPNATQKVSPTTGIPKAKSRLLMVCGSSHANSKKFVEKVQGNLFEVFEMPFQLLEEGNDSTTMNNWVSEVVTAIENKKRVILTTNRTKINPEASEKIKALMTVALTKVLLKTDIEELYIEGGATTYSIIKSLGFSSLIPVKEYSRGVVRMKIPTRKNLYISIKPGSYEWPNKLFGIRTNS